MSTPENVFRESALGSTPIRNLGLTLAGTALEPLLAAFLEEVRNAGILRLKPRFYLSTEWGVPFDTIAIAIPFYLARPELTAIHAERTGLVEGKSHADILRYLRHEMGHVVNYGYQLYNEQVWVKMFGSITQPYVEEYRPEPFSRRFVRHLPGWYAQKHPDEDWAETFAVWMTPGLNWREEYKIWPDALAKLQYCDRTITALSNQDPIVTADELDEDVGEVSHSIDQFYRELSPTNLELPSGLDGALRAIFEDLGQPEDATPGLPRRKASALIARLERDLTANVYRWTGHFPERTRLLVRHLAERADSLQQVYPENQEVQAATAFTTLITALAMNHVLRGTYLP